MFASEDTTEHQLEKEKVYEEFKKIVSTNLDGFLVELLNITKADLGGLLANANDDLDYEDMIYLLAVEDYSIFHRFMYEANVDQDKEVQRKAREMALKQSPFNQASGNSQAMQDNMSEDEAMRKALQASMTDARSHQTQQLSEDEMLRRAMEESLML